MMPTNYLINKIFLSGILIINLIVTGSSNAADLLEFNAQQPVPPGYEKGVYSTHLECGDVRAIYDVEYFETKKKFAGMTDYDGQNGAFGEEVKFNSKVRYIVGLSLRFDRKGKSTKADRLPLSSWIFKRKLGFWIHEGSVTQWSCQSSSKGKWVLYMRYVTTNFDDDVRQTSLHKYASSGAPASLEAYYDLSSMSLISYITSRIEYDCSSLSKLAPMLEKRRVASLVCGQAYAGKIGNYPDLDKSLKILGFNGVNLRVNILEEKSSPIFPRDFVVASNPYTRIKK